MRWMDFAEQLSKEFSLKKCEIVPGVSEDAKSRVELAQERKLYRLLYMALRTQQKAQNVDVKFVGLGHIGLDAPLFIEGFMTKEEVHTYIRVGAVGEITGWLFDENGQIIEGYANDRVNSVPLMPHHEKLVSE